MKSIKGIAADARDLELIELAFAKTERNQAATISSKLIYGAARQCGKVDFTASALEGLLKSSPIEVTCCKCGDKGLAEPIPRVDDNVKEWIYELCDEAFKALERDPNIPPDEECLPGKPCARCAEILAEVFCSECGCLVDLDELSNEERPNKGLCKDCFEAIRRAGICSVCASEEYDADELQESRCPSCYEEFSAYIGVQKEEEE